MWDWKRARRTAQALLALKAVAARTKSAATVATAEPAAELELPFSSTAGSYMISASVLLGFGMRTITIAEEAVVASASSLG